MNRYYKSAASGEVFSLPQSLDDGPPNGCVPVVVISPEDAEQVERLYLAIDRAFNGGPDSDTVDPDDMRDMQAALRSLITPPKPDEPTGLGAVVEDADGLRWMRVNVRDELRRQWAREGNVGGSMEGWAAYADIAAVKVLSEGVTP